MPVNCPNGSSGFEGLCTGTAAAAPLFPVPVVLLELGAAATVVAASRIGIPVSTTHCQIGSIVGCGLANGHKNINWKIMSKIVLSWIVTLPITGLISAAIFSFGYYSPSY